MISMIPMIPSALLLSAGILANPVIISDVKATREADHLRVEVEGDGGIDPEGARTHIDDGLLIIYLGGTRVRADNRAWDLEEGRGQIRAHRHRAETELVVPLVGNGCAGPVELTGTPSGITALVGCEGSVAAPRPAPATLPAVAKNKAKSDSDEAKLKALVELPPPVEKTKIEKAGTEVTKTEMTKPEVTKTEPITGVDKNDANRKNDRVESATAKAELTVKVPAPVVKPEVVPLPAADVAVAAPTPAPASEKAAARKPTVPILAAASPKATTEQASGASAPQAVPTTGVVPAASASGLRAVMVPAFLLAILAGAAYAFARKRRRVVDRHIQIIETASLGPKRSLVVARVGEETLILGTSEAGITLLKAGAAGPTTLAAPVAAAVQAAVDAEVSTATAGASATSPAAEIIDEMAQPIEEALADIPDPPGGGMAPVAPARTAVRSSNFRSIEGGLGRWFGRTPASEPEKRLGGDQLDNGDRFEDVLEDSIEDQELRRKLAAGMSARVR